MVYRDFKHFQKRFKKCLANNYDSKPLREQKTSNRYLSDCNFIHKNHAATWCLQFKPNSIANSEKFGTLRDFEIRKLLTKKFESEVLLTLKN